jgi:hypothetical protein
MMGIRPPLASPSFSPKSLALRLHENSIAIKSCDGSAHRAIPIPPSMAPSLSLFAGKPITYVEVS